MLVITHECDWPVVTEVAASDPLTATGESCTTGTDSQHQPQMLVDCVVPPAPSPNCPLPLEPQHQGTPVVVTAQVCASPAPMDFHVWEPETAPGNEPPP